MTLLSRAAPKPAAPTAEAPLSVSMYEPLGAVLAQIATTEQQARDAAAAVEAARAKRDRSRAALDTPDPSVREDYVTLRRQLGDAEAQLFEAERTAARLEGRLAELRAEAARQNQAAQDFVGLTARGRYQRILQRMADVGAALARVQAEEDALAKELEAALRAAGNPYTSPGNVYVQRVGLRFMLGSKENPLTLLGDFCSRARKAGYHLD